MKPSISIRANKVDLHLHAESTSDLCGAPPVIGELISAIHPIVNKLLEPDPNRFTSEPGSGIVYDPVTGLMWAQEETEALDWDDQIEACAACRLGGFRDWGMANHLQTESIIDLERYDPCLPPIFNTHGEAIWTSTQTPWSKDETGSSRSFFVVGMHRGHVDYNYGADSRFRVRPVRAGGPASAGQ